MCEILLKLILLYGICVRQISVFAVTFTNLDATHNVSDQLVASRLVYTFMTSDDTQTTVTMTSVSSYFEINSTNDKQLQTKSSLSCLTTGSYNLNFLATHTDGSTDTGILTLNVVETGPIMNNLPETIYSLTSNGWPPVIDYTLDIDMGCESSYNSRCTISVSPNDLRVNLLGNNRIKTNNGGTGSQPSSLTYNLTVTCTANNGQSSAETLTLAIVDTIPTTTSTTTSTTMTSTTSTTTTPTTTSTTTTTPTTTSTTTTSTTTTTPTTSSTTTTTSTTTTPTTTSTTTTTPTTTSTTTATTISTTTTTASSQAQTQSLNVDDGGGFFASAAGIAAIVGGSVAILGLLAGVGAAMWKLLGARRRLRRKESKPEANRSNGRYGDKHNRPRLRNIRPKDPPKRGGKPTETSEQMNTKLKPPSREPRASISTRDSLYNHLQPPESPRTSYFHVYYQDASYLIVKPQITPVENSGRLFGF